MNKPVVPPLTIQHLKTSRQYEGAILIHRYWFQWQERTNLSNLLVRFDLLDDAGKVLTTSSVQLPKVKIINQTGDGSPVYDSPVFIKLDDVATHRAAQFRYYVVTGLFKKSEPVVMPMSGTIDDLSSHM